MSRMCTPEGLFVAPATSSARSSRLFTAPPQLLSRRSSRMTGTPHTGHSRRMTPADAGWRPPTMHSQHGPSRIPTPISQDAPPRHRQQGDFRGGNLKAAATPSAAWRHQQQAKHQQRTQGPRAPSAWGADHPRFASGGSPPPRMRNGLYGTVTRPPQRNCFPPLADSGESKDRKLPAIASIPSTGPSSFMQWIVDGWDTNHDGWIDSQELAAGECQTGPLHRLEGDFRA